jgi:hypothetical protein
VRAITWDAGQQFPQLLRRGHTVHTGHNQIHKNDVRPVLASQLQRLLAAAGLCYQLQIFESRQKGGQSGPHHGMVIYQHHANRVHETPPGRCYS